jgi:hypothetical protein
MASKTESFVLGVLGTVTAAVIVDKLREGRARKLAAANLDKVEGPLADVFSSTFSPGWFWAEVPTQRYSDPRGTPLDTAIRGRFVTRAEVVSFGPAAARTWVLIHVPRGFKGPAAWELDDWATWHRGREGLKLRDLFPVTTVENPLVVAADVVNRRAQELGDAAKAAASSAIAAAMAPIKAAGVVLLGAAALGLFFRMRGRS